MPILVGSPPPTGTDDFPGDLRITATLGESGIVLHGGDLIPGLDESDAFGVTWDWSGDNVSGDKPSPREEAGDRSNRDGQWDATQYYGPRTRDMTGGVTAPDNASLHAAEQRLRDAIGLTRFQLGLSEPGFSGYSTVRQQGGLQWSLTGKRTAVFSFSLYAPDPFIYSASTRSFELSFPTRTGGRTWPATWPGIWDAVTVSGEVLVTNPSARPVPLQLQVVGPVTTATIADPDTGQALYLIRPDGLPLLASGEYLEIDTARHSVLLQGTANRRSWVYGDWLLLPVGDSRISIGGVADTAARVYGSFTPVRL